MKKTLAMSLLALAAATTAGPAAAFDFGFVRVPDWMDGYILALLVAQVPFWVLVAVTKPRGLPFNEVYRNYGRVSAMTRVSHIILAALFLALMAMIFVGMGLRRMAEAGAI